MEIWLSYQGLVESEYYYHLDCIEKGKNPYGICNFIDC